MSFVLPIPSKDRCQQCRKEFDLGDITHFSYGHKNASLCKFCAKLYVCKLCREQPRGRKGKRKGVNKCAACSLAYIRPPSFWGQ